MAQGNETSSTSCPELNWSLSLCVVKYLRRDHIISHIPEPRLHVRRVGEGETFHFGGDAADDRVCLLVGLLHHTHIPAGSQQQGDKFSFFSKCEQTPTQHSVPPHPRCVTHPTTYSTTSSWMNLNTHPTLMFGITRVFGVS